MEFGNRFMYFGSTFSYFAFSYFASLVSHSAILILFHVVCINMQIIQLISKISLEIQQLLSMREITIPAVYVFVRSISVYP